MCQLAVGFSQAAPERWLGHRVWHHFSSESPLLLLSLIHCYVWITNGINETITNSCERFCNECHWLCISFPSTFYMLLWSNGVIALHSTGLANPNSSTGRPGNWAGHSPVKAQKLGYIISPNSKHISGQALNGRVTTAPLGVNGMNGFDRHCNVWPDGTNDTYFQIGTSEGSQQRTAPLTLNTFEAETK